jgi:hypothetical protein
LLAVSVRNSLCSIATVRSRCRRYARAAAESTLGQSGSGPSGTSQTAPSGGSVNSAENG